jgi:hypothetical protein
MPSLTWFRPDYKPVMADKAGDLENYNKLLGLLGFTPANIRTSLKQAGHDEDFLTTENIDTVRKIIRDASLESFLESEQWKTRKKR